MSSKPTIDAEVSPEGIKPKEKAPETKVEPAYTQKEIETQKEVYKPKKPSLSSKAAIAIGKAQKAKAKAQEVTVRSRTRLAKRQKEKLQEALDTVDQQVEATLADKDKYPAESVRQFQRAAKGYKDQLESGISNVDEFLEKLSKSQEQLTKRSQDIDAYIKRVQQIPEEQRLAIKEAEIPLVSKERLSQLSQLEELVSSGTVERETSNGEFRYKVKKPPQYLTDEEETLLKGAGFKVPELEESLSWKLWEEAEEIPATEVKKAFGVPYSPKGIKQATASAVAGTELFLAQFFGLTKLGRGIGEFFGLTKLGRGIGAGVRGEKTKLQETLESLDIRGKQHLNVDFIEEYMPNIGVGDAYAAKAIAYGVGAGLNAVTLSAVGTVVGTGVGTVGTLLADALKTPIGKAGLGTKIGGAISRLPGGKRALDTIGGVASVMKPIAGTALKIGEVAVVGGVPLYAESMKVLAMKEAGYPDTSIAGHVAMDVSGMLGFITGMSKGLEIGKKLYSKGKYYVQGGRVVSSEEVIPDYVLREQGRFPSFRAEELKPTAENYVKLAEKYAPDEMRLYAGVPSWHATSEPFHKVFSVKAGLNKRGEAGMFFSFGGSTHFLRLSDDAYYSLCPGLPRFSASPQFVYGEFPRIIETNLSKSATGGMGRELREFMGTGTLVMPNAATQMVEGQAILSPGTKMVEVRTGNFWMNHKGYMIKIGRYLPQITADELGINYISSSVQSLDDLMGSLSNGGVVVNPSTYLPVSFPLVSGISYPEIEDLIVRASDMTPSELSEWASVASPGELAAMSMILSDALSDVSYTSALSLATPTILSEYPELSSKKLNLKSNLTVDYGSHISDTLTGDLTYSEPSPPPVPSYTPDLPPDTYYPPPPPPPEQPYPPSPPRRVPKVTEMEIDLEKPEREVPKFTTTQFFRVRLVYYVSSEEIPVEAKGFREAYENAYRIRKHPYLVRKVRIERIV